MARKRVVAYVRVSSSARHRFTAMSFRSNTGVGSSTVIPTTSWLHIYSRSRISVAAYTSGQSLMKMLQDARAGQFDVIHTKSVSRFARNTVELLEAVRELRDMGVEVIFEKEQISTMQPTSELFLTNRSHHRRERSGSGFETTEMVTPTRL